MRYYRIADSTGSHLVAEADGRAHNLTAVRPGLNSFRDLLSAAQICNVDYDEVAKRLATDAPELPSEQVTADAIRPLNPDEVWAAGVTYEISEQARERESGLSEMYLDVYEADRPEIFFKATADRTVGPNENVGIRGDSKWNVPEPELGIVIFEGRIVGYTIGNDMSSRDIEGANPLYLPQAKIYDRSCAIGPAIISPDTVGDPHNLSIDMHITRSGEIVFEDDTSTGEMVRTCDELTAAYHRHNTVPELAVLLTGASIVPPDEFTLQPADTITITIENIGVLENRVQHV